jgi:hypothetical protein
MALELFAQINPNGDAYRVGQLVGLIVAVVICAVIPISFGARRDQALLGIIGAVCTLPGSFLFGCLGGLPIALFFVAVIAIVNNGGLSFGRPRKKKKKKRRRPEYDEVDEVEEVDERPRRRRPEAAADDDDEEERPRRRRRPEE